MAAFIFASSKSRTNHWVHMLLPLLEKTLGRTLSLPARKIATPEEFFQLFPDIKEVLLDGTERPTIRRKNTKTQKKNYSGKKKRPTRKNTIMTDKKKRILFLSPSKHGHLHDKKQFDKNNVVHAIPEEVTVITDTGFL